MQRFVSCLLDDVQALEYMLENDWFESDITRIGAEQEMCLVHNKTYKPATINMQVLERLTDAPWCVTELARFNLETNLLRHRVPQDAFGRLIARHDGAGEVEGAGIADIGGNGRGYLRQPHKALGQIIRPDMGREQGKPERQEGTNPHSGSIPPLEIQPDRP